MATVTEIAPDIFRICALHEGMSFQFNSFLVRDEEPLLYHTNLRGFFPEVVEAVKTVLDPAALRWIGFSHFEADECGSLNDWLALAPQAAPLCSFVAARTCIDDICDRPARVLAADEFLDTGAKKFRQIETKHLPHGWDASMLFEETGRTLFCSDLFGHRGDVEALTEGDILGRAEDAIKSSAGGPMSHSVPVTAQTGPILDRLAALAPKTLACMHGSSYRGDGAAALTGLGTLLAAADQA
jgi:flavorubredoxin